MDIMDAKTLSDWAQWGVMLVISLVVWLRKPGEDAQGAVAALRESTDGQLASLAKRMTALETHLEHMPTSEELAKLEGMVKQLDERTQGLSESLAQVRRQLDRIETFMMGNR
jgi:predicted  nucleic acid-binding Zn-ribbon protein